MHHVANKLRRAVALCALVVPALALAACGGDNVPGNAVAKVDDDDRSRRTRSTTGCRSPRSRPQGAAAGRERAEAADPRRRRSSPTCVANKKKTAPKPAKGQPAPTRRGLQGPVQAGVRGAARPGHAAPDPERVGHRRGRSSRTSRSPTPRSRRPSTSRRSSRSRRRRTTRSSSRPRASPRRTSSSACASSSSRTSCARRSSRARTRSPTSRSRPTTTRTRSASPSPSAATCASS